MTLDGPSQQRLRTSIANLSKQFDAIVHGFVDRLTSRFPTADPFQFPETRSARFLLAHQAAAVLKNISAIEFEPCLLRLRERLNDSSQAEVARQCLLESVRDAAGSDWSPELEADWTGFLAAAIPVDTASANQRLAA